MKNKNKTSLQKTPKNTKIFKQLVNIFGDIKSNVDHKNISHYIQMLKSEMKFLVKSKKLDIDNKDNYYALLYSITSIIGLMKDMSKLIVKDEKHVNIIFMLLKEKFDKFADKIFIGHLPKARNQIVHGLKFTLYSPPSRFVKKFIQYSPMIDKFINNMQLDKIQKEIKQLESEKIEEEKKETLKKNVNVTEEISHTQKQPNNPPSFFNS
jgi:hypothetical protein